MIRVLIVDDSPTVAYLLRSILQSDPEVRVVGEARTGEDGVAQCQQLQPDLVTMDVEMPGMGGLEAIRQIMDVSPRPIVVVTAVEARRLMAVSFRALELGAPAWRPSAPPAGAPSALTRARAGAENAARL